VKEVKTASDTTATIGATPKAVLVLGMQSGLTGLCGGLRLRGRCRRELALYGNTSTQLVVNPYYIGFYRKGNNIETNILRCSGKQCRETSAYTVARPQFTD